MRIQKSLLRVAVCGLMLIVGACSRDKINYFEADVSTLYFKAHEFMGAGQNRFAAVMFDEVERQHPYSRWARRATLMSAYNHYLSNDYDSAILAAQRFLALHPGNRDAPYAYYLVAICYYEQITDVERDQRTTQLALDALNELVRRYPNTDYAQDARLKLDLASDHLAGKEMEIGRFYMRAREYIAAVGRFRSVVTGYQRTSHVPEALHRLCEAYVALGVYPEAQRVAAVLGYNYPDSEWYKFSYELLQRKNLRPAGEAEGFFENIF